MSLIGTFYHFNYPVVTGNSDRYETSLIILTILTGKNLFSAQKLMEIQGWLLLTFSICLHNQLSYFNSIIAEMSGKRDSSNKNGCFFQ